MLRHFLLTAFRNFKRSKLFTAINLIGLSLGIAVFLTLTGYVRFHYSFDDFYPGGDKIYRVNYFEYQEGQTLLESARTFDRTALLVHEYVPQVEAVTRVYNEKAYIWNETVRTVDQDMLFADSSFFKVFPTKVILGSAEKGLEAPHSVMISQSQAHAFFGEENPIGKVIFFNERLPITVTGVFEDLPDNSSMDYDYLVSWSTIWSYGWAPRDGSFRYPWTFVYVRLGGQVTDLAAVNTALSRMVNEQVNDLKLKGHTARQELQAYTSLHLSPPLTGEFKPGISPTLLLSLIGLAIFILASAWINYVNLALARSLERADEIGVRKAFGATQSIISRQFLTEAVLLASVAFSIGLVLFLLVTGPWSDYIFEDHAFTPPDWWQVAAYFVVMVAGTSLAAFYPARYISKFKPALILRNKLTTGGRRAGLLRQALMIVQLFMAICVLGLTLIASRQLKFVQQMDTGFSVDQTIALRAPASTNSDSLRFVRYTQFKNEVLQLPSFRSGTATMNIPGQEIRYHDEALHAVGSDNLKQQSFWVMWVDEGYEETYGMTRLGGRNFQSREKLHGCMINESAARALGYKDPQQALNSKVITGEGEELVVLGLWKDYHHESLHKPIVPIVYFYKHPHEYGYYSFRMSSMQGDFLSTLKGIWQRHYPNDTFSYYFANSFFESQYKSDLLFERMLSFSSLISMAVAFLGLFGMASLAMVKRMKEIGVRKALGASVWSILALLSSHYLRLVVISCVAAFPLLVYLGGIWLDGFYYHIGLKWWLIVLPGVLVGVATLLAVGGQCAKAALMNPSKTLKSE